MGAYEGYSVEARNFGMGPQSNLLPFVIPDNKHSVMDTFYWSDFIMYKST